MPQNCRPLAALALPALMTFSSVSFADTRAVPGQLPPILVEADQFQVLLDEEKAVWRGNVEATQGNYTFRAGSLTLHMDQIQPSGGSSNEAAADPSAAPADYELSAENVSYDLDAGQIVATGNGELRRGVEMLRANHIVYTVAERRASARPAADGRVQVQFHSNPDAPLFPVSRILPTQTLPEAIAAAE